MNFEMARDI